LKLLDLDCRPELQDNHNWTTLMYAFKHYSENKNHDSKVLLKLLDLDCKPNLQNVYGHTALMYAFRDYSTNENHDPDVLLKLLDLDCKPELQNIKGVTVLTNIFTNYNEYCTIDINVLTKLLNIGNIKNIKDKYNSSPLLYATKSSNKKLLNFIINNLHTSYKDNLICDLKNYEYENKFYPIDYLVKRIYDYDKIDYDGFVTKNKNCELDIYPLLHLLSEIDYDYKGFCSKSSEEFIEQVLITKDNKQYVFDQLLYMPPIDGVFVGGVGFHQSMIDFEKLK
jgi:ankyrin repeat protein